MGRGWSLWTGFVLMLLMAAPVLAHANLARSSPVANSSLMHAPDEIRLWFTEAVEPDYSSFSLRDSSGNPVPTPHSQVDPTDPKQLFMQPGALPHGLYTVVWRTVSAADGHSINGSFAFGIGVAVANNPVPAIDESVVPAGVAIRWLNLFSLSLAVGCVGFWLFVGNAAVLEERALVVRRWRQLTGFGWVMIGISALLLLLLQVSTDANSALFAALTSPTLGGVLTHTAFGQLWFARVTLWGLFGLVFWASIRTKRALWIVLIFGALLLVVQSLFSHASAAPDRAAIANDWLHLASSALWIGGLASFVLVLFTLRGEPDVTPLIARLTAAFSNFARVAVALLLVTGLYAAWLEVGSVDALLHTAYGQALLVKGILFLPLLAIAAVNLLLTQRGLDRGELIWAGRLRGLVSVEIVLTVGILLAVGVMTSGSPARDVEAVRAAAAAPPQQQPYFAMEIVNNQMMHLQIIPGYVGTNQFIVTPFDETGSAITDASLIRLRFTNLDQNLGGSELRPTLTNDEDYVASGANLSIPGHWRIRMTVARPGKFDMVADFNANIELPPPVLSAETITAIPVSERTIAATLAGILLLGIGGFFIVQTRRSWWSSAGVMVTSSFFVGLILLVNSTQLVSSSAGLVPPLSPTVISGGQSVTQESMLTNPIQANSSSVDAGHTLFVQNCVLCHGAAGKGDGPVGLTLNPRPADLTKHTAPGLHTDGQLYEWITHGYPHSAMPAFGERLSDADRWNLVNYIRTLGQTS